MPKGAYNALVKDGLALLCRYRLQSKPTHSDRLRDEPLDAGATFEVNHFEKVPILAKAVDWFSGNE
jgi:hypothetical protein